MNQYHKIQTVFLRNPDDNYKTLLEGQFALPEFEYLQDNDWIFTEKVDGTNIRVIFDGSDIEFRGKTDNAQIPEFLLKRLEDTFLPKKELFSESFPDGVCFYGEGYGARIQKGGGNYISDGCDFVLFDIKIGEWWLQRTTLVDIADEFCVPYVPVVGIGTLWDMVNRVRNGFNSVWGDFPAEGLVAKPVVELQARNRKRIVEKLKHKDFK